MEPMYRIMFSKAIVSFSEKYFNLFFDSRFRFWSDNDHLNNYYYSILSPLNFLIGTNVQTNVWWSKSFFCWRMPRANVERPATSFGSLTWKKVKAISDHVRLAYGKNKRSSSMGITNGERDRNSPDHQNGGDRCVHTLHTGHPHYYWNYHIYVSLLLLREQNT